MFFCARKITYFQPREISREVTRGDFLVLPKKRRNLTQNRLKPYFSVREKSRIFRLRVFPGMSPANFREEQSPPKFGGGFSPHGPGVKLSEFGGDNF